MNFNIIHRIFRVPRACTFSGLTFSPLLHYLRKVISPVASGLFCDMGRRKRGGEGAKIRLVESTSSVAVIRGVCMSGPERASVCSG